MRPSSRAPNELRTVSIEKQFTKHAEGSVLIAYGDTKVLCTASVTQGVPRFLKGSGQGWVTAEYGMLPRSTTNRMDREAARGKQSGRTQEIQRLIGRSLRAMVDLKRLGDFTIVVDCDVLQADGGTRTASITGGGVALINALETLELRGCFNRAALNTMVCAVSVGIYDGEPVLDLDYAEDSNAHTDMNVVMNEQQAFIEVQGTAENGAFTHAQLNDMLALAVHGGAQLFDKQREVLEL